MENFWLSLYVLNLFVFLAMYFSLIGIHMYRYHIGSWQQRCMFIKMACPVCSIWRNWYMININNDNILLSNRLSYLYGISGTCLSCLAFFVKQNTVSHHHISQIEQLHGGATKTSVIGSILFLLCKKPLANLSKQHAFTHHSFVIKSTLLFFLNMFTPLFSLWKPAFLCKK